MSSKITAETEVMASRMKAKSILSITIQKFSKIELVKIERGRGGNVVVKSGCRVVTILTLQESVVS